MVEPVWWTAREHIGSELDKVQKYLEKVEIQRRQHVIYDGR